MIHQWHILQDNEKKSSVNLLKPQLTYQISRNPLIWKQNFGMLQPNLLVKTTVDVKTNRFELGFSNKLLVVSVKPTKKITKYKSKNKTKNSKKRKKNYNKIKIKTLFYTLFRHKPKIFDQNDFFLMTIFITFLRLFLCSPL